ncbi:MAG: hypothetical protein ACXW37_07665 [Nitrospira sp.]
MALHLIRYGVLACCVFVLGIQLGESKETAPLHRSLDGIVVDKAGSPAVKVPDGTVYQLNENRAARSGRALPRIGEEVTVIIDEDNAVIEMHPKGTVVNHRFITGEVVSVGLRQGVITLKTSDGEQTFPLEKREMSASVRDGSTVKAELNEAGNVIDLQPTEHKQLQPDEKNTPINRSH